MSIQATTTSEPPVDSVLTEAEAQIVEQWLQHTIPGCRLCRALAHRSPIRPAPILAVGLVTIDDLGRFASSDR